MRTFDKDIIRSQGDFTDVCDFFLIQIRPACHLSNEDTMAEIKDRDNFMDLLKKMLYLDVDKRILPSHLIEDPFITMSDLAESYPNSF